jgi:hypothetical protein
VAKSFLVATIFAISSFAVLEKFTALYAVVALFAMFLVLVTLHDLSKDIDGTSSFIRLEETLENISPSLFLVLMAVFGLQVFVYSPIDFGFRVILQRGTIKALLLVCLCKMVSQVT